MRSVCRARDVQSIRRWLLRASAGAAASLANCHLRSHPAGLLEVAFVLIRCCREQRYDWLCQGGTQVLAPPFTPWLHRCPLAVTSCPTPTRVVSRGAAQMWLFRGCVPFSGLRSPIRGDRYTPVMRPLYVAVTFPGMSSPTFSASASTTAKRRPCRPSRSCPTPRWAVRYVGRCRGRYRSRYRDRYRSRYRGYTNPQVGSSPAPRWAVRRSPPSKAISMLASSPAAAARYARSPRHHAHWPRRTDEDR